MSTIDYRAAAAAAAQRAGIDPNVFLRQIGHESGFHPDAHSPAGALGIAQIVPHWHPDAPPASDPVGQLNWAAHYMANLVRQYGGSYAKALSVYNSGKPDAYLDPNFSGGQTYNYVRTILGAPETRPEPGQVSSSPSSNPSLAPTIPPTQPQELPSGLPSIFDNSFLRGMFEQNSRTLGLPAPNLDLLSELAGPPPNLSAAPTLATPTATAPPAGPRPSPATLAAAGDTSRWVTVSPTADRSGVATKPAVLDFVGRVAQTFGHPLTIGTGTNHNEYVVGTHRESAHWTGYAADIPATGSTLTQLGRAALVAAGMPAAEAAKQTGGLFNVGPYQVIFNSNEGGNHFNHLHVGIHA